MAIAIHAGMAFTGAPEPPEVVQKRGHLGYQNLVTASNISATSSAAGFAVAGLANPLTAQRWKPEAMPAHLDIDMGLAVDVDYFGLASHNFADAATTITPQYSIDGITYVDIEAKTPTNNRPIMFVFDLITARYWRLKIEGATAPELGVLYIGLLLVVEREIYGGHTPITMGRNTKKYGNQTEGGQFAGVSIVREYVKTSYQWRHLGSVWYRDNMDPFILAARSTPFFIAWRYAEYPDEVGYVWAKGDPKPVNMGVKNLMELQMNVEGYTDE